MHLVYQMPITVLDTPNSNLGRSALINQVAPLYARYSFHNYELMGINRQGHQITYITHVLLYCQHLQMACTEAFAEADQLTDADQLQCV